MSESLETIMQDATAAMKKAISHLETELTKIRAGKATPAIVDGIHVDYYGNATPLNQVANITIPDARTISLQPWEKNMITAIEKAITYANLGFNPQNDGTVVRISLPPLTEERRKQLVKMAKETAEHGKVTVRNLRKDGNEAIKKLVKAGVPEDEGKIGETKIQDLTDKYIAKIDEILKGKETEILTV